MDLAEIRNELRRRGPSEVLTAAEPHRRSRLRLGILLLLALLLALPPLVLAVFRTAAALREVDTASALAPPHGQFVAAGDKRMFLQQKGPAGGVPVVLIHGTGAWSELWRPVIDHLAGAGFRVIALDMPPFGFSDRPHPADYSRAAQAERIVGALNGLNIDKAVLVGHSFGAGPTVEAVLRHPSRVRGLILVAGALGISSGAPADPSPPIAWVLDQAWLRNALVAAIGTNPLLTRQLLSMMIHRKDKADARAVAILQRPITLRHSTNDLGVWLKSFLAPDRAALSAARSAYAAIDIKTALIWGDQDTLTPLAQGLDIHSLIRGSTLSIMPGVGHIPQVEDPDLFAKTLSEILVQMGQ